MIIANVMERENDGQQKSGEQQIQKLQQNWWQVRDNWRISVKTVG